MDSALSLMESESSLGTNKQAGLVGAGNAKYPHLPLSPISSKDVTVIYLKPSHSSPQAQIHPGGAHTHTHTHTHTQISIFQCSADLQYQPLSLPGPNFKVAQPLGTRFGLPERPSLGSGVTGSRALKLVSSLWSRSALFSPLVIIAQLP